MSPDLKSNKVETVRLKVGDIVEQIGDGVEVVAKKDKVFRLPIRIAGAEGWVTPKAPSGTVFLERAPDDAALTTWPAAAVGPSRPKWRAVSDDVVMRLSPDLKSDKVETVQLKVGDIVEQIGDGVEVEVKKDLKVFRLLVRVAGVEGWVTPKAPSGKVFLEQVADDAALTWPESGKVDEPALAPAVVAAPDVKRLWGTSSSGSWAGSQLCSPRVTVGSCAA